MSRQQPTLSGPLAGAGRGWPFGCPLDDLAARGYRMEEFILSGEACAYRARAGTTPGPDGVWETEPGETAAYVTRLYVVRPADPARFNGVLVINWQNVTANVDLGFPGDEETFRGYAWAGVTTQKLGVDGLAGQTQGLTAWDPVRYGALTHPGDAWSYDIYAQAARLLRKGPSAGQPDPMGGLRPTTVIATGSSQSAMRMGSYINIAHPHDQVFDGFYLVVHWGMCPPIEDISLQEQFKRRPGGAFAATSRIHDRGDAPILVLATECEALHNYPVRQPDTDSYRFWEVAGAAHTDSRQSDVMAEMFARDGVENRLGPPPNRNSVEWGYIKDAGLRWITRWVREKVPPPRFPVIEIKAGADGRFEFVRDALGNVRGGLRIPEVAAATGVHKGTNSLNPYQALSGESRLFTPAEMAAAHGGREAFLAAWDAAVGGLEATELVSPDQAGRLRRRGREAWG